MINKIIYKKLKEVAHHQTITTYSDIAPLVNIDMDDPSQHNQLANYLGDIYEHEHAKGQPLLSAVVVRSSDGLPGMGFYNLAKDLGVVKLGVDHITFVVQKLQRVHKEWL